MQKDRRRYRRQGQDMHTIGFAVYEVRAAENSILPFSYFTYYLKIFTCLILIFHPFSHPFSHLFTLHRFQMRWANHQLPVIFLSHFSFNKTLTSIFIEYTYIYNYILIYYIIIYALYIVKSSINWTHILRPIEKSVSLMSTVQRLPECASEEKLLPEPCVVCPLRDLHQPARGEHAAPSAPRRVHHRALHLRAQQRGRLCSQGLHWEAVRNRVCLLHTVVISVLKISRCGNLSRKMWFCLFQRAGWWNLSRFGRWCTYHGRKNGKKYYTVLWMNSQKWVGFQFWIYDKHYEH